MKSIKFTYYGKTYELYIEKGVYYNDNIALQLYDRAEGPFAALTVNIERLPAGYAAIDTNNFEEAEDIIEKYNLGTDTGKSVLSGYCIYPVYQLNMSEIEKYVENRRV